MSEAALANDICNEKTMTGIAFVRYIGTKVASSRREPTIRNAIHPLY